MDILDLSATAFKPPESVGRKIASKQFRDQNRMVLGKRGGGGQGPGPGEPGQKPAKIPNLDVGPGPGLDLAGPSTSRGSAADPDKREMQGQSVSQSIFSLFLPPSVRRKVKWLSELLC